MLPGQSLSAFGRALPLSARGMMTDAAGVSAASSFVGVCERARAKGTPSFVAPLTASIIPTVARVFGTPTFTRSGTTATFFDHEGVPRKIQANEARFYGARRVQNLLAGYGNVHNWAGVVGNAVVTATDIDAPDGTLTATRVTGTAAGGAYYNRGSLQDNVSAGMCIVGSAWVRGSGTLNFRLYSGGSPALTASVKITLSASWVRYSLELQLTVSQDVRMQLTPSNVDGLGTGTATSWDTWGGQLENCSGQSNKAPAELVSFGILPSPYHGANVDAVKYFPTTNGNSVAANVVTEAPGTPIADATLLGYHTEGQRTNDVAYCRILTDSVGWVVPTTGANLITNGTFDSDVSGWSLYSTPTTTLTWLAGGYIRVNTTTYNCWTYQNFPVTVGKTYVASATTIANTTNAIVTAGVHPGSDEWDLQCSFGMRSPGTNSGIFTATETTHTLRMAPYAPTSTDVDFDNITVYESLMTIGKTSGIDGIANTATRLTAQANDTTILQPRTEGASTKTLSAYVKRVTGTGSIYITRNGGTNWTDITSQINGTTYTRVTLTSSVANPSIGFKIATSGDAIDVDYVQDESGAFASTPIGTTTATTRNADVLAFPLGNVDKRHGAVSAVVAQPAWAGMANTQNGGIVELIAQTSSGSAIAGFGYVANPDGVSFLTVNGPANVSVALTPPDAGSATPRRFQAEWGPYGVNVYAYGLTARGVACIPFGGRNETVVNGRLCIGNSTGSTNNSPFSTIKNVAVSWGPIPVGRIEDLRQWTP